MVISVGLSGRATCGFLREYVYVDVDRVSGLAGQLYDGVPERATNVVARQKKFEVDLKLIRGGGESGSEDATERNLADSLFKDLESDLEVLGCFERRITSLI